MYFFRLSKFAPHDKFHFYFCYRPKRKRVGSRKEKTDSSEAEESNDSGDDSVDNDNDDDSEGNEK